MSDEPTHTSSYTEQNDSNVSGDGANDPVAGMASADGNEASPPISSTLPIAQDQGNELESNEELEELRRILLGDSSQQDAAIFDKIDQVAHLQVEGQLEEISKALPEAIIWHKTNKSARLNNALSPTIEETLTLSVRRNPQPIADAIFPVIGPAIRKSIREALKSMMDSVNNMLENSFSAQSIKWRMEARATGKTFSEVVLAHTLDYRVEQIFLIERDSGVLLRHVYADGAKIRDGDVISGMLRAVQAFVRDTLDLSQNSVLDSVNIDGLKIIVEPGPKAILAAVIRGIHSPDLNEHLKEIIENVHLLHGDLLDNFDGDEEHCQPMEPLLKSGLVAQQKEKDEKPPWAAFALVTVLGLLLAIWFALGTINLMRWNSYLDNLREQAGIVVTETGWKNGKWVVQGLHDPLAPHPDDLLPANIPRDRVISTWEPYLAMDQASNLRRIEHALQPPPGVNFELNNGVLTASGKASSQWIQQTEERVRFLVGITQYDFGNLQSDMGETASYINNTRIVFSKGSNVVEPEQAQVLQSISNAILSLTDDNIIVTITGYTSPEGTEITNRRLSQARSDAVREALVAYGVPRAMLTSKGTGGPLFPETENGEDAMAQHRSVTFTVGSTQ